MNSSQKTAIEIAKTDSSDSTDINKTQSDVELMAELLSYLRKRRVRLCSIWMRQISRNNLMGSMTVDEILKECSAIYENYLATLETGSTDTLEFYAQELSARIIPLGVGTQEVIAILLLLRDVLARSLFSHYGKNHQFMKHVLDIYEPAANRIALTVTSGFLSEQIKIINEQRQSILELSTPLLSARDRSLIVPIVGILDAQRARKLSEQLLTGIKLHRARVVVIDMTGVPELETVAANFLNQTITAARFLGAEVILTGMVPEIAEPFILLGIDLSKISMFEDLKSGVARADEILGRKVFTPISKDMQGT